MEILFPLIWIDKSLQISLIAIHYFFLCKVNTIQTGHNIPIFQFIPENIKYPLFDQTHAYSLMIIRIINWYPSHPHFIRRLPRWVRCYAHDRSGKTRSETGHGVMVDDGGWPRRGSRGGRRGWHRPRSGHWTPSLRGLGEV